ncbi:hypothetical protein TNIN_77291 [Trichonephila inaurata madagascariensis]|uniref:Uncharacterized protein n=1 Tax=Trichonephila inaurata madagascariensis TaxID=2747483 RepID=A0A8X7BSG6_9ARAC|nr:hypothetical protein TNIN_77291 [Trichonephila inaurata madagascariensis]
MEVTKRSLQNERKTISDYSVQRPHTRHQKFQEEILTIHLPPLLSEAISSSTKEHRKRNDYLFWREFFSHALTKKEEGDEGEKTNSIFT